MEPEEDIALTGGVERSRRARARKAEEAGSGFVVIVVSSVFKAH